MTMTDIATTERDANAIGEFDGETEDEVLADGEE
jgi:hypothetical protein